MREDAERYATEHIRAGCAAAVAVDVIDGHSRIWSCLTFWPQNTMKSEQQREPTIF
jgi:hypothetical protein